MTASTIVLLRGLMRESRHWGDFLVRLSNRLPTSTIIAPDLAGNGLRCHECSPVTVAYMVDDLRGQLACRAVQPPYHLLALSLGGMIASEWLARYPQEVSGCTLINTSMRGLSPLWKRLRPRHYAFALRMALLPASAKTIEKWIFKTTCNRPDPAIVDSWISYRKSHPVKTVNALRQLLAASRYQALPQKPAAPVCLLSARADQLVDTTCSTALAAHWGCPLKVHPTAGHDLPHDAPDWVIDQLCEQLYAPVSP